MRARKGRIRATIRPFVLRKVLTYREVGGENCWSSISLRIPGPVKVKEDSVAVTCSRSDSYPGQNSFNTLPLESGLGISGPGDKENQEKFELENRRGTYQAERNLAQNPSRRLEIVNSELRGPEKGYLQFQKHVGKEQLSGARTSRWIFAEKSVGNQAQPSIVQPLRRHKVRVCCDYRVIQLRSALIFTSPRGLASNNFVDDDTEGPHV